MSSSDTVILPPAKYLRSSLTYYNNAKKALALVHRVDQVKDIRDKAKAMQVYARQAKDGELIAHATEIRMRAEIRAGELLAQMAKSGERAVRKNMKSQPATSKLTDLGVNKTQSSRWQKLAAMPPAKQEQAIKQRVKVAVAATEGDAAVVREARKAQQDAKRIRRDERERELGAKIIALPDKKYGVILADPEWQDEVWSETGMDRSAANHYPVSTADVIAARDVGSIAARDCVLFLWATNHHLRIALDVMEAWGFEYKSNYVWVKDSISMGRWNRSRHEILLIGTRGSPPAPALGTQWDSVIEAPKRGHSVKPDAVLEMIESYFPNVPKIELNARKKRDGWARWGNEAPLDEPASSTERARDEVPELRI